MTADAPDPLVPAASHPATRSWIRRWLGTGAALTLLGAALLGVSAHHWNAVDAQCVAWVDAGDTTLATVTETHPSRFGNDTITVQVSFTDRPPDEVAVSYAGDYTVGDEIVLAFDPQHPETLVETSCDNQDVKASAWSGVGGVLTLGFGLPFLVLTTALARGLRRDPWREVVTEVESSTAWWATVPGYTITVDDVPVRIAAGMSFLQGPVFEGGDPVTVWVAGPAAGRSIPVAQVGGGSVFRGVARRGA